jgi:hypothetical protein
MNASDIGIASTLAAAFALIGMVFIMRMLPARMSFDPRQSQNLMDQLINEQATARQLRTEVDVLKVEVTQLRAENASLKGQIATLWALVQGQNVAKSSEHAATQPAQPGNRTKAATAHFADDDVAFRDWLLRHFDAAELEVLAANAGMDKPVAGPLTSMATALVQASRRIGSAESLQREALEMRPQVAAW